MGAAQIWALSYFGVAGAFLASLVERLLSVCRRPHRGRSAPSALTAAAPATAAQAGTTPQLCEAGGNTALWRISQG